MITVVIGVTLSVVGVFGLSFGIFCGRRLAHWEKQLRGARIGIAYKGRVKMDPTLYEVLQWALAVERDETRTGKMFYSADKVSVSVLEPRHKSHGQAKTHTV